MTSPSPAPAPSHGAEPVFHIAVAADWAAAQPVGEYRISTLGRTLDEEGYIHASTAGQLAGVLAAFYHGVTEALVLLRLDTAALPILWEPAVPGGELFPHIYGPIPVAAVVSAEPVERATAADGAGRYSSRPSRTS